MKALPERKFLKTVKQAGCEVRQMGSGEHGIYYKGKFVCSFGVWHKKGSKREVGEVYLNRLEKLMGEINDQERKEAKEKTKSELNQEQEDDQP